VVFLFENYRLHYLVVVVLALVSHQKSTWCGHGRAAHPKNMGSGE
jgi:hypothetical protein